ncbi:hypothetical protein JTB14_013884 [Gonioctena quinquepunctata]|nr:hypothetical protein JTB14_013884 [Gonioctena quinquepunctata]
MSGIYKILEKYKDDRKQCTLDFNVDGLPIHKSTKESFWPILCEIAEYPNESPFPVAIFSGPCKPPLNLYFNEFMLELKSYSDDGIVFQNSVTSIACRSFCCDTPARAYIKNTKSHNAYVGCDKCLVKGIYINHKMTFTDLKAALRTDDLFASGDYGDYQKGPSPLSELNIGMVSKF